jgi:RES domain-containing protein
LRAKAFNPDESDRMAPLAAVFTKASRLFGGRWNPKGVAVVYCSRHLSLLDERLWR